MNLIRRTPLLCALALTLPLLVSCAGNMRQRRPYLIRENLDNAARHLEAGRTAEAAQIYRTVLLADPCSEEAFRGVEHAGDTSRCIMEPSVLGVNCVRTPRRDPPALRIIAYPVSRLLDILDVVSFELGPQGGLYGGAHVTRALQASAGAGGGAQIGWWQKREFGVGAGHVAGLCLIPFSLEGEGWSRVGTRGARNVAICASGLNRPSDYLYQHHRDYWSAGARAIVLLVGARLEVHPVEAADALAGLFFVDFLRDDIGSTRSLSLSAADREAMEELVGTLSDAELRARMRGRAVPPGPGEEPQEPPPRPDD